MQGDLDEMIEHAEPAAAVPRIRALHDSLYGYRKEIVGSSAPDLRVRPCATALCCGPCRHLLGLVPQ